MTKIVVYIKKFWLIIGLLVCCELYEIAAPQKAHAAFDSLLDRESQVTYSGLFDFVLKIVGDIYICFYKNIMYNPSELSNTCIPRIITSDSNYENDCSASGGNEAAIKYKSLGLIIMIASLVAATVLSWIPFVGQILFIAAMYLMVDTVITCLGTYVLAPHEYINGLLNRFQCEKQGNKIVNVAPDALTVSDVPFFYNCADQQTDKNALATAIANNDTSGLDAITGYGNMNDPSMPYCQGGSEQYALNNLKGTYVDIDVSDLGVGSLIIGNVGGLLSLWTRGLCEVSKDTFIHFNLAQIRNGVWNGGGSLVPYYRLNNGKIQLCAASISRFLGSVVSGCSYIVPPIEAYSIDAGFTSETRCIYFLSTRTDLNSLGNSLIKNEKDGNYSPVGLFLQSDFHMMSTIMGCIQDLLIKVVVAGNNDETESFLYMIQNTLKGIIYVVLILYVSILGIKIMSKPNPPEIGEVIMYVLKFGVVVAMSGIAGQNIWYNNTSNSSSSQGLYILLLDALNNASGLVLQSTNNIAPVNMCYLDYEGKNLLSERSLDATPASQGTKNALLATTTILPQEQGKLMLSTWDFVDCKLASYLSLNSCKYSISGMISMWLISMVIALPTAFLLGIITIIFGVFMFLTMFRFVHITIVSMFALTVLVLVSPIIACFLLFEFTKDTFKTWFKMLLGYILYPAMVFAFLGLMITTFDSIFYGLPINTECTQSKNCTISDICGTSQSDNSSIYCIITRAVSDEVSKQSNARVVEANMCNVQAGTISKALMTEYDISIGSFTLFRINTVKFALFPDLFLGIAKMLLFMILFYYMLDATLLFFETLLGIHGIANMTPNYVAGAVKLAKSAAMAAAGVPPSEGHGGAQDLAKNIAKDGEKDGEKDGDSKQRYQSN
jgi:type IV secretion system protein VirB6